MAPAAEAMYRFVEKQRPDEEVDEEAMYKSPLFIAHARAVFGTVDAAVGLVKEGKTASLADVLVDLGRRHFGYGVQPPHFEVVGQALMHTFETALGEKFTDEARQGWVQVYSVVSTGMIEGCYYAMIEDVGEKDKDLEEELLRTEEEALCNLLGDAAFFIKDVRSQASHPLRSSLPASKSNCSRE
jgi:hypothetical protein